MHLEKISVNLVYMIQKFTHKKIIINMLSCSIFYTI